MKRKKLNKHSSMKSAYKVRLDAMIKVAVMGCTGRMGGTVTKHVLDSNKFSFIGGTVRKDSEDIGKDIGILLHRGHMGILVSDDPEPLIQQADVIIDFTVPESTARHATLCAQYSKPFVAGTTGLSKDLQQDIVNASEKIPVLFSPNMSIGITLMQTLVKKMAQILDTSFDIEIVEMHHRHKLDAPSGTAISIGQAAATGRGIILEGNNGPRCRTGPRHPGEIGFSALRGGEVAGVHTAVFAGNDEVLELTHRANDRNVFASGALTAAEWIVLQPRGLYRMHDVLGISNT
jgi:4-hydroxy-tetrahydrodipicolinate reductase